MATVMEDMQFDATEELGEDGLTHLQRKVFYQLVCRGGIKTSIGANEEFELVVELGLQPGMAAEIQQAMQVLVEMGRVKRYIDTVPDNGYGGREAVRVAVHRYLPVNAIGLCNEVLAWVALYGPLEYEEISAPASETVDKTNLAIRLGTSKAREQELLEYAVTAIAKGALTVTSVAEPAMQSGSYGKVYPVMKTTVTLALAA